MEPTIAAETSSPIMAGISGLTEREYKVDMSSVQSDVTFDMANEQLSTGFNVLPRMEITGSTTTQVLLGMAGVSVARYHGHANSPLVLETSGLVDREVFMEFKQVATELALEFSIKVANGTHGFVKRSIPAQGQSPMMLMLRGMLDQDYDGSITGDINDAP